MLSAEQSSSRGGRSLALAEEQGKLIDERLATKVDLTEVKNELEAKIAETRAALEAKLAQTKADLETKIAETKAELIKWVVGIGFAQTAMIVAVIKLHS